MIGLDLSRSTHTRFANFKQASLCSLGPRVTPRDAVFQYGLQVQNFLKEVLFGILSRHQSQEETGGGVQQEARLFQGLGDEICVGAA